MTKRRKRRLKQAKRRGRYWTKEEQRIDQSYQRIAKPVARTGVDWHMKASNEFIFGTAKWSMVDGIRRCVEASPSMAWMLKMEPAQAKLELARRGFTWSWTAPELPVK